MMDSSAHLVGLTVPCHVCGESLTVPNTSSSESGSFVLAQAAKTKPKATLAPDPDDTGNTAVTIILWSLAALLVVGGGVTFLVAKLWLK
jgi:hypothetical protein